jgi:hypothetical protein
MDKTKLALQIAQADIRKVDSELLLMRLKVASHEGVAAIVREFDALMVKRRCEVLPSHRDRRSMYAPMDKMLSTYSHK